MSPVSQLSILALATAAVATPLAGNAHGRAHERLHSGSGASWATPIDTCTDVPSSTGSFKGSYTGSFTRSFPGSFTGSFTGSFPGSFTGSFTRTRPATSIVYVSPIPSSSTPATNTWTSLATSTHYETVWSTISVPESSVSVAAVSTSAGGEQCGDITVTSTAKVYVTVTGEPSCSDESATETWSSPASSATTVGPVSVWSSSSAPAAPAYSHIPTSEAPSAPVYTSEHVPSTSSSEAAPAPTSSTPAPVAPSSAAPYSPPASSAAPYSPPATSEAPTTAAPVPETSSVQSAPADTVAPSSAAAATTSASSSPATGGKRGLAYNDASLNSAFSGSDHISWAYNWLSSSAGLSGYKFIPMLHSGDSVFTESWNSDASSAISSGSTHLFSFNEPDIASQANMAPGVAATDYVTYMNPFAGKAQLCAPAVSNSNLAGQGLEWLSSFLGSCGGKCHIDCYNVHYYNSVADSDDFKKFVSQAASAAGNAPLYVSEFAIQGASDDEIDSFLQDVMPWMDSNDQIAGYAYFMVKEGLLLNGDALSPYGTTYKTYSS